MPAGDVPASEAGGQERLAFEGGELVLQPVAVGEVQGLRALEGREDGPRLGRIATVALELEDRLTLAIDRAAALSNVPLGYGEVRRDGLPVHGVTVP